MKSNRLPKLPLYIILFAAIVLVAGLNIYTISEPNIPALETTAVTETNYLPAQTALALAEDQTGIEAVMTKKTTIIEVTEPSADPNDVYSHVAARWVDGEVVPMTNAEIAEFEKRLYQCQTVAEYEAMMDTLAYYNKGVDMSKFPWFWNELDNLYSDEQIALMRQGSNIQKPAPSVVGMEIKEAYRYVTDMGFVFRFSYSYHPDSDLPVGYCIWQDIPGGMTTWSHASIMVQVQAPPEINQEPVRWDPDNWNFDIIAYVEDLRATGSFRAIVPDVIGLPEAETIQLLTDTGLRNIIVQYSYSYENIAHGCCVSLSTDVGDMVWNTNEFIVYIQSGWHCIAVPDLIGLSMEEAASILDENGQLYEFIEVDEYPLGIAPGHVVRQGYEPGFMLQVNQVIPLYIQCEPSPTPDASETETAPTSDPTMEPTVETTSVPEPTPTETHAPTEPTSSETSSIGE